MVAGAKSAAVAIQGFPYQSDDGGGVHCAVTRFRSHCDPELAKRMGEKLGEEDLGKEDWREGSARRRRWLRGEGGGRREGRGGEEQEQTALIKSS